MFFTFHFVCSGFVVLVIVAAVIATKSLALVQQHRYFSMLYNTTTTTDDDDGDDQYDPQHVRECLYVSVCMVFWGIEVVGPQPEHSRNVYLKIESKLRLFVARICGYRKNQISNICEESLAGQSC